jgi:hypothetical protein
MDPILTTIASQGVFAALFAYLGHRQLKQSDRLQEQNDKLVGQLYELNRQSLERERANTELVSKTVGVLDKISQRLDK